MSPVLPPVVNGQVDVGSGDVLVLLVLLLFGVFVMTDDTSKLIALGLAFFGLGR